MSILGHMIDESHWFRHHMKNQMKELSGQSPFISALTDGPSAGHLRNLRPAFACLYDEPVPNATHIVGELQRNDSNRGRRIEFLLTQDGMCIEMVARGGDLDIISEQWDEFISEWNTIRSQGGYEYVQPAVSFLDQQKGENPHMVLQLMMQQEELGRLDHILRTFQNDFTAYENFLDEFCKRYR